MVQVKEREVGASLSDSAAQLTSKTPLQRRGLFVPTVLQIFAMIGIGALLYSNAADWFATFNHNSEISGYVEQVAALPNQDREAMLEAARDYNSHMPQGVLRDPYSSSEPTDETDSAYDAYSEVLNLSEDGVIGQVKYAELGIALPLYHGTSEAVITKGVGHLYGSSLPVGGPSTHSVLTAHAGLVHASLFTPLPKADIGDVFEVGVLGENHYYQVDQIETVLPEQTEGLRIVDGEDYVTLFTCTPIGINSHRLLVRGVRVDGPADQTGRSAITGDGKTAGMPWWALIFLAGSATTAYILFAPPRKKATIGTSKMGTTANEVRE